MGAQQRGHRYDERRGMAELQYTRMRIASTAIPTFHKILISMLIIELDKSSPHTKPNSQNARTKPAKLAFFAWSVLGT